MKEGYQACLSTVITYLCSDDYTNAKYLLAPNVRRTGVQINIGLVAAPPATVLHSQHVYFVDKREEQFLGNFYAWVSRMDMQSPLIYDEDQG